MNNLSTPENRRELRRFTGLINYYRDLWPNRSETLGPLTALTSKNFKVKWTEEHQEVFGTMKKIVAIEVMFSYPASSK